MKTCKHNNSSIYCAQCDKDMFDWHDYSPATAAKRVALYEQLEEYKRGGVPAGAALHGVCAGGGLGGAEYLTNWR